MTTIATSGTLSYEQVEDVVEAIVAREANNHFFPDMDRDDVAQEIRTECLRVLEKFDASRIGPSPYKFLYTCVKNKLYNLKRGIYVPNNPPCSRCPLWDVTNKLCTIDEIGCSKIVKYRENMAKKAAIRGPASLDYDVLNNDFEDSSDAFLLDQSIRSALPESLVKHYDLMLLGKPIPSKIKNKIRQITKEVIKE